MRISQSVELAAPIDDAFELVSDDRRIRQWMPGLLEMTYDDADYRAHPVGSTFRQKIRESGRISEYVGEVLVYEPPERLAVHLKGNQFGVTVEYWFRAEGDATILDYTADLDCTAMFARRMATLFNWLNDRVITRQMENLASLAASGSVPPRRSAASLHVAREATQGGG